MKQEEMQSSGTLTIQTVFYITYDTPCPTMAQ